MKYKLALIFSLVYATFLIAQNNLHPWYEEHNLGIEFNKDQTKVLIVAHDVATLWNTIDGSLIKSMKMPLFQGKPIKSEEFIFIDAAPDLSEFIYITNGKYQRYKIDIEDLELFPDFQRHRVKNIYGYDSEGWIVFFSEGFYQGFYRVQQKGNTSFLQFISMEYVTKATISNDHNYIYFTRDRTFRYVNINTKEVIDTKLPAANWRDQHLPKGMVTLYKWNANNKAGKKVEWRYFIRLGKEPSKKIKGKKAQSHFNEDTYCLNSANYVYAVDPDSHWSLYSKKRDGDGAKYTYQFYLKKEDRQNDCKSLQKIYFTESETENKARKQQKSTEYWAQKKKEKLQYEALKPSLYNKYISKFIQLPNTYKLNYNNISGVEVTNTIFVQKEKYRLGNPSEFAIGRIAKCSNGNKIILRMTRSIKNGMDRSSFRIFKYDSEGNLLNNQKIAETQKFNGQFPILSNFTITNNQGNWTANVTVTYQNGKEYQEAYNGSCSNN
ncbi:hypothetical protein [Lutibacter sp.]